VKLMKSIGMKRVAVLAATSAVLMLAGCAGNSRGTLGLDDHGPVQGRDLGRGGAESGGLSSVDPSGNAADYSMYDARQIAAEQKGQ
jgi:hypothetical protein